MLAIYYLIVYLQEQRKTSLIIMGLLSSLAVLTRYVGISLFATTILCLFIYQSSWKERIKDSLLFLAVSLPGLIGWAARNMLVTGNPANRQILFHPIPVDKLDEGVLNFWRWLLPERGNLVVRFLPVWGIVFIIIFVSLLFVLVWLAFLQVKKHAISNPDWFIPAFVIGLQAYTFLGVLFFSLIFVDASPPLDLRIILPFTICIFLLGVGFLGWLWKHQSKIVKGLALTMSVVLFLSFAEDTLDLVRLLRQDGQGFASSFWQESQTVEAVKKYPDRIIFTNKPTALVHFN